MLEFQTAVEEIFDVQLLGGNLNATVFAGSVPSTFLSEWPSVTRVSLPDGLAYSTTAWQMGRLATQSDNLLRGPFFQIVRLFLGFTARHCWITLM